MQAPRIARWCHTAPAGRRRRRGLAVAMQAAQLCKQLGLTPRRTLRVIAWMNEENGGTGNKAYMAEYEGSLSNHVAAIESDFGAGHPLGFAGLFSPSARAALEQI